MRSNRGVGHYHRSYVVSYDMASLMQAFKWTRIKVPSENDPMFASFQKGLTEMIWQSLPGVQVHSVILSDLRSMLWDEMRNLADGHAIVSTRHEVSEKSRLASSSVKGEKCVLNINRLFDIGGNMIGYGPRPGFPSLETQFSEIRRIIGKKPVILIEDGSVSGGTIIFILKKLKEMSITVSEVVIGFSCFRADTALEVEFDGNPVIVHQIGDVIDWLPDHDLVPFTPNCGRVFGKKTSYRIMPAVSEDGITFAYPYILHFGKMPEWSSLTPEACLKISRYCLEWGIELWESIGSLNGRKITVGELAGICPRISIPIEVGRRPEMPSLDVPATELLREMRKRLD